MPDLNDDVLEVPALDNLPKENDMSGQVSGQNDVSPAFGGLLHNQLAQSGNIAQNNFITVQKAMDYDYLENKRMVTLDEAVGVREVQSAQNPGGPSPRQ